MNDTDQSNSMKTVTELLPFVREEVAIATVVQVAGSSYRRPGARMLIYADGSRSGTISGGCLEADVAMRGAKLSSAVPAEYIVYDARSTNGDLVIELGCQGTIGILIESVDCPDVARTLAMIHTTIRQRTPMAIATIYQIDKLDEQSELTPGSRLVLSHHGQMDGSLATTPLASTLIPELTRTLQSQRPENLQIELASGRVHLLLEPIVPPIALHIVGAGHDAEPLARMANGLGWQVSLHDHRASLLAPDRFPGVQFNHCSGALCIPNFDTRSAVVIMNHSYERDMEALRQLISYDLPYIGLLGPRKRCDRMLAELQVSGIRIDPEQTARLYSPIGLDLGADSPEEIALSIIAEIQSVLNTRSAVSLRNKQAPIH